MRVSENSQQVKVLEDKPAKLSLMLDFHKAAGEN